MFNALAAVSAKSVVWNPSGPARTNLRGPYAAHFGGNSEFGDLMFVWRSMARFEPTGRIRATYW